MNQRASQSVTSERARAEFARSVEAHAAGRLEQAAKGYREVLRHAPEHLDALNNLGGLCLQRGDAGAALPLLERAVKLAPERADIIFNRALALHLTGDLDAAAGAYEHSLRLQPERVEAAVNLAQIHRDAGRLSAALALLEAVVARTPDLADAWIALGGVRADLGRTAHAIADLTQAVLRAPERADLRVILARAQLALGQVEQAEVTLGSGLAMDAKVSDGQLTLAEIRCAQGRVDEALAIHREHTAHDPRSLQRLVPALIDAGALAQAAELLTAATAAHPHDPALQLLDLRCAERGNRLDHAATLWERMDAATRARPEARLLGARLQRRAGDLDAAAALLADTGDDDGAQAVALAYEKARVDDLRGEVDGAWRGFVAANRMAAAAQGLRPGQAGQALLQELAAAIRWRADGPPVTMANSGPTPVFLLGFPRSGTTLLEQVLDAHPAVRVLDEAPAVDRLAAALGPEPLTALRTLDPGRCSELRASYLEAVGAGDGVTVIDKLPLATARAPLLAQLFPDARIIFAARHPCDVVLSCFMQQFELGGAMDAFVELDSTVATYTAVMTLWAACRDDFDHAPVEVRYESLIEDLQAELGPVMRMLQLDWDPRQAEFHRHALARGAISTPSYDQVSRPLYRAASGRWLKYRTHLAPILDALAPYALSLGYDDPRVVLA